MRNTGTRWQRHEEQPKIMVRKKTPGMERENLGVATSKRKNNMKWR